MKLGEYFSIAEPYIGTRTDEHGNTVLSEIRKAFTLWEEDVDSYIMDEIIKMCKEHGITDLYVLNKNFILSAIREKMEKEAMSMTRGETSRILNYLKDKACSKAERVALSMALAALRGPTREMVKFKEYFGELYGNGLEVYGWHLNGDPEPFDNFYESACEYAGL